MKKRYSEFGRLLTEAVRRINSREDVPINVIHDELGYALGKKGGDMLPKWRQGRLPSFEDVEKLARQIAIRTDLDRAWVTRFLKSATHTSPELLCNEIFGIEAERMTQPDKPPSEAIEDWGDAPVIYSFHGRQKELEELESQINDGHCHLVGIFGTGGIGKTTLSKVLAEQISSEFELVKWVSLRNGPLIDEVLSECILSLSGQRESDLLNNIEEKIALLVRYLQDQRCLLIFDKLEAVLKPGGTTGEYRDGYETYGQLLNQIGRSHHKSCLLITSRERPAEFARLPLACPYHLDGVDSAIAREILHEIGLAGSDEDWDNLVDQYSGNPLMLQIASETIHDLFGGDIARFLQEETFVFGDVYALLDEQFERLSALEKDIMFWLAIERELADSNSLLENLTLPVRKRSLWEALESLSRRHLIYQAPSGYSIQDVVMEYVTNRFVDSVVGEIKTGKHILFNSHALIKATAREYVRQSQVRFILEPLTVYLLSEYTNKEMLSAHMMRQISLLQKHHPHRIGYAAGNTLNLLTYLKCDLVHFDFTNLVIRQANLQGVELHNVDFSYSDLSKSVFTETFSSITSIAVSPDGKLLAAGMAIGDVHIWLVDGPTYLARLEGHSSWVRATTFSPDSQMLASGSSDTKIRLWDVKAGECRRILEGHNSRVRSVVFTPNGKNLISAGSDTTIRVWDVNSGECLKQLHGHDDVVWSLALNPHTGTLISGSFDKTIKIWDLESDECLHTLEGHEGALWVIAINPEGNLIASSGDDKTLRLWNPRTGECYAILEGHTDSVKSLAFSLDGRLLASGSQDQNIRLWDTSSRTCERTLIGHTGTVEAITFHPYLETVISGSEDQSVRIWDNESGKQLRIIQGYVDSAWIVAFHPNGNEVAVGGSDPTIRLWDVVAGNSIREFIGHTGWVEAIAFSPDGTKMVSCGSDRSVRLWDTSSGKCLQTMRDHSFWVSFVSFSPDGRFVASCGEDLKVCLWDLEQGIINTLIEHTNSIRSVAFSSDSSLLASSDDDGVIRLWEVSGGRILRSFERLTVPIWSVAFDLDNRFLASGSHDHIVRLWDIDSGEIIHSFNDHSGWISTVAFSPDGRILSSASTDKTVRLWEAGSWKPLHILDTGTQVWSFSFSPDNRQLVTGGNNETFKIWDLKSGQCVKELAKPKPYEGLNITGATGITPAQRRMILALGAKDAAH